MPDWSFYAIFIVTSRAAMEITAEPPPPSFLPSDLMVEGGMAKLARLSEHRALSFIQVQWE
jgi:hypothetical protein